MMKNAIVTVNASPVTITPTAVQSIAKPYRLATMECRGNASQSLLISVVERRMGRMAGRQLKELVRAFRTRDELAFRRATLEIIEEEEARHHFALARDLRGLLAVGGEDAQVGTTISLPISPRSRDGEWDLIEIRSPQVTYEDLVLQPSPLALLSGIEDEASRWSLLDQAGVPRRQKLLFTGAAGTGKTSAAEAIASGLGWPLAVVSVDTVVSSYLGETASNLRRVFEFAQQNRVVLVFDEFDALGRARDDSTEHGEMKRVVSSFLQFLERYSGPSLIVAITNYPKLLDFALWRRFDEVAEFALPTVYEIRRLLSLRTRSMATRPFAIDSTATSLKGMPQAAVEKFVFDVRRQMTLSNAKKLSEADIRSTLAQIRSRPW